MNDPGSDLSGPERLPQAVADPPDPGATGGLARIATAAIERKGAASRYLVVSIINVVNHQILLNLANSGWGWSGGRANLFAAAIAAVPAYLLSRYWVWEVRGSHSLRGEIIPFWTLALLGLVVSTVLAEWADRTFGAGIGVALASLVGYGIVWVLKFAVLEKLFERSARRTADSTDA